MSKINIFKEDDNFILEHINDFNYSTKKIFKSDFQLQESLKDYAEHSEITSKKFVVDINLEDKTAQEYLEMYCDRVKYFELTTWKSKPIFILNKTIIMPLSKEQ